MHEWVMLGGMFDILKSLLADILKLLLPTAADCESVLLTALVVTMPTRLTPSTSNDIGIDFFAQSICG